MKTLEPVQYLVNSMEVVSLGRGTDRSVVERRVFIGHFSKGIDFLQVSQALDENNLWTHLVATGAAGGAGHVSSVARVIDRGVIFESVDEFIALLKLGVRYEDIVDGWSMASEVG